MAVENTDARAVLGRSHSTVDGVFTYFLIRARDERRVEYKGRVARHQQLPHWHHTPLYGSPPPPPPRTLSPYRQ